MCFKFYKSQLPVIEQAIETPALILGSDKSRAYCLEKICVDFLAGDGNPNCPLKTGLEIVRDRQFSSFPSNGNNPAP